MYNLLVLGPMERVEGDVVTRESHTLRLRDILQSMSLYLGRNGAVPFSVSTPEASNQNVIVKKVLDEIENADLIIIDLSGNSPSVSYEAAVVHALGIPHILVTTDASEVTAFYFKGSTVIQQFNIKDSFSPEYMVPSHRKLFDALTRFLNDGSARRQMAGNILTTYYDGLPLADVSGPSGLATGYFTNAVMRFIQQNGYTTRPCFLLSSRKEKGLFGRPKQAKGYKDVQIKALIAIEPINLRAGYKKDWEAVQQECKNLGVELEDCGIHATSPADMRQYGGWFFKPGLPKKLTFSLEIPSTLYTIVNSPRVGRIRERRDDSAPQGLEEKILQNMRDAFGRNLKWHLSKKVPPEIDPEGFHYIPLSELKQKLKDLKFIN